MSRLRFSRIRNWLSALWQFLARIGQRVWAVMTSSSFWKVVGGVVLLAVLVGVQFVPELQVRRAIARSTVVNPEAKVTPVDVANLENEFRKTYLQAAGGILAIIALIFTYRRVVVAEQGHITDRYMKAIEQLGALTADGKPNVEVRLGAIYALERIAQDSPRDHWTIMEVLTAYVRQNAPAPTQAPTKDENDKAIAKGPATEIQAIITVLGRRRRDRGREQEGQQLDLTYCDLRGAIFDGAHIEGASLRFAHLERARFDGARLERVNFFGAHARMASFYGAYLEGASFDEAYLEWASFNRAHFAWAHGDWPTFLNAHVEGANFQRAVGLSPDQFEYAEGWEQAKFDEVFARELKTYKK
jgi:hypothetical protein